MLWADELSTSTITWIGVLTAIFTGVALLFERVVSAWMKSWGVRNKASLARQKADQAAAERQQKFQQQEEERIEKGKQDFQKFVVGKQQDIIDSLVKRVESLQEGFNKLQEAHMECREENARITMRLEMLESRK